MILHGLIYFDVFKKYVARTNQMNIEYGMNYWTIVNLYEIDEVPYNNV